MKCPIDTTVDLVMADRSGIEIDYCPTCRGVWLDRGELDKIIERSAAAMPAPAPAPAPQPSPAMPLPASAAPPVDRRPRSWDDDDWHEGRPRHDDDSDGYPRPYRKKKKSSFLGEIFDF